MNVVYGEIWQLADGIYHLRANRSGGFRWVSMVSSDRSGVASYKTWQLPTVCIMFAEVGLGPRGCLRRRNHGQVVESLFIMIYFLLFTA